MAEPREYGIGKNSPTGRTGTPTIGMPVIIMRIRYGKTIVIGCVAIVVSGHHCGNDRPMQFLRNRPAMTVCF